MRIVDQEFIVEYPKQFDREKGIEILKHIEQTGRNCYKSEHKITEDSYINFVKNLVKRGHMSVIEHFNITARFITDRGTTHSIVRHRIASFSQESTRYCKYKDGIDVIKPVDLTDEQEKLWEQAMYAAEDKYLQMLRFGATPQQARSVLPTGVKTDLVMTCNLREWLHVFNLRTSKGAHPDVIALMNLGLPKFQEVLPEIFGCIG